MIRAIADTHAVIWYINADPRLLVAAKSFIDVTGQQGDQIGLSSITFAELVYLTDKGRINASTYSLLVSFLTSNSVLVEIPFDEKVAAAMFQVDRLQVPDMPDRIIAATALQQSVPLISRDGKIKLSNVTTIW